MTGENEHLETMAMTLSDQALAIRITNQPTYDTAVEFLRGVKALRNEAEAHHKPVIDFAHKTHKAALAALQRIDGPLEKAERVVKGHIAAWTTEQDRIHRAEEERLRLEAQIAAEAEVETALLQAEAEGATLVEIQSMIAQQDFIPPPVVSAPRTYQQAAGVSTRKTFRATVTNMVAFVQWVADNPPYIALVTANIPALNQMARAQQGALKIPGVRVEQDSIVSAR